MTSASTQTQHRRVSMAEVWFWNSGLLCTSVRDRRKRKWAGRKASRTPRGTHSSLSESIFSAYQTTDSILVISVVFGMGPVFLCDRSLILAELSCVLRSFPRIKPRIATAAERMCLQRSELLPLRFKEHKSVVRRKPVLPNEWDCLPRKWGMGQFWVARVVTWCFYRRHNRQWMSILFTTSFVF